MNCPSCGSQMPDGAKFCATCGSAIAAEPAPAPAPQEAGVVLNGQPTPAAPQPAVAQQPVYAAPSQQATPLVNVNVSGQAIAAPAHYESSDGDKTLFLIAFILNLLTIFTNVVVSPFLFFLNLICLAWVIPMTVHTWGIYKGKKANTTAFGVCTLIFVDLISGILLLVAKKHV